MPPISLVIFFQLIWIFGILGQELQFQGALSMLSIKFSIAGTYCTKLEFKFNFLNWSMQVLWKQYISILSSVRTIIYGGVKLLEEGAM